MHVTMAAMKPDGFPAAWITTAETARRLGLKPRSVIDAVTKGKLHPRKYLRPGVAGGAISLFDPAEVAAVMQARAIANTEVMPAGALIPAPQTAVSVVHTIDGPAGDQRKDVEKQRRKEAVERRLAAFLGRHTAPLWLRYDEAVLHTGLAEKRLRELVANGKIRTDQGPHDSTVLWRADVEKASTP